MSHIFKSSPFFQSSTVISNQQQATRWHTPLYNNGQHSHKNTKLQQLPNQLWCWWRCNIVDSHASKERHLRNRVLPRADQTRWSMEISPRLNRLTFHCPQGWHTNINCYLYWNGSPVVQDLKDRSYMNSGTSFLKSFQNELIRSNQPLIAPWDDVLQLRTPKKTCPVTSSKPLSNLREMGTLFQHWLATSSMCMDFIPCSNL